MELLAGTLFITLVIIDICGIIYIIKASMTCSYKLIKWAERIEAEIKSENEDT